jgi:serine protease
MPLSDFMKKLIFLVACALSAMSLSGPALAQTPIPMEPGDTKPLPPAEKSATATDGIIVKFRAPEQPVVPEARGMVQALGVTVMQEMSAATGMEIAYERPMSGGSHVLRLPTALPPEEAQAIADSIAQLPLVEYASPVIHMQTRQAGPEAVTVPNDTEYGKQWHYFAPAPGAYGINLPEAWNITTGNPGIVVAVLDTGIRFDHPDFAGRTVAGYDFISSTTVSNDFDGRDADASDPGDAAACPPYPAQASSWHGTHVAGTIGAASNNGTGVAGVNWVSKIQPVRVLGKCGNDDPDIIDAMRWAAGIPVPGVPDNPTPAKVINLSLGGGGSCTSAWQSAVNDVVARGVVVVVAAGNSNANTFNATPANCNGVIAVGATLRNGKRASYSNYGGIVKVSAPGGTCASACKLSDLDGILSTYNAGTSAPGANSYNFLDGTSMATPHVAGVVSLMFSVNPFLSPGHVLSILQVTATAFPDGACDANATKTCGAGIVNAGAAVALAKSALNITPRAYLPSMAKESFAASIVNGNFESGPANWQASSAANPGDPLIYQQGGSPNLPGSVTPRSGKWAAWMGGYQPGVEETALLSQKVIVPARSPYLVYYTIAYGGETNCGNDYVRVLVDSAEIAGSRTSICNTPTYGTWVKRSVNLSAYASREVTIAFNFFADDSTHSPASSVFIDDVRLSEAP